MYVYYAFILRNSIEKLLPLWPYEQLYTEKCAKRREKIKGFCLFKPAT